MPMPMTMTMTTTMMTTKAYYTKTKMLAMAICMTVIA
jgi:hypothetical protein